MVLIPQGATATGKVALVTKKKWKGRGGKLGITVDQVQSVTGQTVKLRAYDEKSAGTNRRDDIAGLIIGGEGVFPVFGAALIPLVLLEPGKNMIIGRETRFTALTDGATPLDVEAVMKAQPLPERPRPDVADVYIYRLAKEMPEDRDHWPVTCGEQSYGTLDRGRYIHIELPPDQYWLQAGVYTVQMDQRTETRELVPASGGGWSQLLLAAHCRSSRFVDKGSEGALRSR